MKLTIEQSLENNEIEITIKCGVMDDRLRKLIESIRQYSFSLQCKNNSEVYKALHVDTFKEYVSGYITTIVINAIAFIITYLIVTILLFAVCIALNIISKLPIINGLNKTAGLLVGLFEGLLVIWMLCIVLTAFSSTETAQKLFEMIKESQFLSCLYDNNLLIRFITNMAKVLF